MAENLTDNEDVKVWEHILKLYPTVLNHKAQKEKKNNLKNLDDWFQKTLPKNINSREEKYVTHDEISKLMEWKLMRGKFRPRLKEMVKTNDPDDVINISKSAFKKLPDLSAAIKELSALKAIGPATASAVLAAGSPEYAPFMADESLMAIPGLKREYTLKHYIAYADEVIRLSKKLKKKESSVTWDPHNVELALWTHYMKGKLGIGDENSDSDEPVSKKSKKK